MIKCTDCQSEAFTRCVTCNIPLCADCARDGLCQSCKRASMEATRRDWAAQLRQQYQEWCPAWTDQWTDQHEAVIGMTPAETEQHCLKQLASSTAVTYRTDACASCSLYRKSEHKE